MMGNCGSPNNNETADSVLIAYLESASKFS